MVLLRDVTNPDLRPVKAHVPSQLSAGKRPASRNTCTAAATLFLASSHISNPVIHFIYCLNGSGESWNRFWWNSCN